MKEPKDMTYDDALTKILKNNEDIQEALKILDSNKSDLQMDVKRRLHEFVENMSKQDISERSMESEASDTYAKKYNELASLLSISRHFPSDIYNEIEVILKSGFLEGCNHQLHELTASALVAIVCNNSGSSNNENSDKSKKYELPLVERLKNLYLTETLLPASSFIVFYTLYTVLSSSVGYSDLQNPHFTEAMNKRHEDKTDCLRDVLNRIAQKIIKGAESNSQMGENHANNVMTREGMDLYDRYYQEIKIIAHDCIKNGEVISETATVIKQMLARTGINHNCSLFKDYLALLRLVYPKQYCKAVEIYDYIRKISFEDENIFELSTLEEVGRYIYTNARERVEDVDEDTVRIAIKMLQSYPLNQRKAPTDDVDYYREIVAYKGLRTTPDEVYRKAWKLVDDVRMKYRSVIDKIDMLELECRKGLEESALAASKAVEDGSKCNLFEDNRSFKKQVLKEIQKGKEISSLYREDIEEHGENYSVECEKKIERIVVESSSDTDEQAEPASQTEPNDQCVEKRHADGYLEYCKKSLEEVFKLIVIEQDAVQIDVQEIDNKSLEKQIRKWVIMECSSNHSDFGDEIAAIDNGDKNDQLDGHNDERNNTTTNDVFAKGFSLKEDVFDRYLSLLDQFEELLRNTPDETIHNMRCRIKALPFMEKILQKYRMKYGVKIADKESNEYKEYFNELSTHPLHADRFSKIKDASAYLEHLRNAAPQAINMIGDNLEKSACFNRRADIVKKVISFIRNGDYSLVVNVVPVQIEGLVSDYLENSLLYETQIDFKNYSPIYKEVFERKASRVMSKGLNLGFDIIGYFKYYFSSVCRNTVAHGNYWLLYNDYSFLENTDEELALEILAYEMLFDLNTIIDAIAKSNEIDEAKQYIESTSKQIREEGAYERLLYDLMGKSRYNIRNYQTGVFVENEPKQILYWCFNPYFEKLNGKADIEVIRNTLTSEGFWKFVKDYVDGVSFSFVTEAEKYKLESSLKALMSNLKKNADAHAAGTRVMARLHAGRKVKTV